MNPVFMATLVISVLVMLIFIWTFIGKTKTYNEETLIGARMLLYVSLFPFVLIALQGVLALF